MAKESFDKEIQFLRMLALTTGAYSRQQFAERLGISVHTFDKTLRKLKEIASSVHDSAAGTPGEDPDRELGGMLRYNHYETSDPMLMFLFRAKSLKETEIDRLSLLLGELNGRSMTAAELLDSCCSGLPADAAMPDEKTIRSDLKYLEEVGVIRKVNSGRPARYQLHDDLIRELSAEELQELYDYVDCMANTQLPSVQGYLLRDSLKSVLKQHQTGRDATEPFLYKYHYHSRILDEAHLYPLFGAIAERRTVSFIYFSPKSRRSYASRNTNPLFERKAKGLSERILPLRVVYDHQYGRWYLLGHNTRQGIMIFRMEGLTDLVLGEPVEEERFSKHLAELEAATANSWLVDTGRQVLVKARFYNPEVPPNQPNFVKERVQQQGQWGVITEEGEDSFLYEITVNGPYEIKPWLRSFGSSCEVLEPAQLRREFIAEWKEIQRGYEPV
ncbi:WYL domain-containing protein [Paenibacillus sambharensis]|uniref:WYL domain-containing protein n=1 Tax=Paenibacillus sambharensis TaxID=1803190 RepID=A0A2W1LD39_9BACL|nr:WYL domain-containing protein [Paenibacillus sambharensis]PZD92955.1 WYL domain-containing protein [Paenibacillus sambharensis]